MDKETRYQFVKLVFRKQVTQLGRSCQEGHQLGSKIGERCEWYEFHTVKALRGDAVE